MPQAKKLKVLVIEDEALLIDLYEAKLLQDGYKVLKAENGLLGFELAKDEQPDLILLDILMPEIDGFETLRRLKNNQETKNIPVIIFSNLSQHEEVEEGLKLGASDFIIKTSITPTELSSKVKEYLEKFKK